MKTLDAKNRSLGRVASEVAMALMGKDSADYEPNKVNEGIIHVVNASLMKISEKKKDEVTYDSHSGYPGSLKFTPMRKVIKDKGYAEIIRRAVKGMLPNNKLRSQMLKNIKVTD